MEAIDTDMSADGRQLIRERWAELRPLLERAIALPAAQRNLFIDEQTSDAWVRSALRTMLADTDDDALPADDALDWIATPPERIGPYRILRELGRGGMGVVYLAEQAAPRRQVALKRLASAGEPGLRARFLREAELLARLSHPNIAQVIEANIDEREHPYLVMEYVDGVNLATHAATLSRAGRIALLAQIADAVEHAHARGVVHRDLKPSNILLTTAGQPKVLDFGIGQEIGASSTLTQTGMLMGTPAYMSPEQAAGVATADARSDIYALGVIGYELLANRLPLPLSGMTPLEALRAIGHDTPPPLARLDPSLRGDLDTVIGKALAREPGLRYASAGAFADDLRRVLAYEPIRARRPSAWRRFWLYARRQPTLVGALALAVTSLIAGSALALHFGLSASRERDRAEAALANARGTQAALSRVFSAGNPVLAGKPEVPFRDVLRAAPDQIEDLPPAIRLPVHYTVALAQMQIGDERAAIDSFAAAAQVAGEVGNDAARAQAELRRISLAYEHQSRDESAHAIEALLREPAVRADPVLNAAALVLAAEVDSSQMRARTASERLRRARAAWPVGTQALPIDDPVLLAQFEIRALVIEFHSMIFGLPVARAPDAYLAAVTETHTRLNPLFGADDPTFALLGVLAEHLPSALAAQIDWRDKLLSTIDSEIPRLGLGHPAILVRLHAGLSLSYLSQFQDRQLSRRLVDAARAVDGAERRRLRLLLAAIGSQAPPSSLGVTGAELGALQRASCGDAPSADLDCLQADLSIAMDEIHTGRQAAARARLDRLLEQAAALPPHSANMLLHQLGFLYTSIGAREQAIGAAEAAIVALQANTEIPPGMRDKQLMSLSWSFRPDRCDRVLELILPIEARLATSPGISGDVLARLLSTCEVRANRDTNAALARLEPWWRKAQQPGIDPMLRFEVVNAYLEIFFVLGREGDFGHWARELAAVEAAGIDLSFITPARMPWLDKARRAAYSAPAAWEGQQGAPQR